MDRMFITAVGTGIGKTLVTAILCFQLARSGRTVRAIKPVVTGFSLDDRASDPALILRSLGLVPTPESIAAIAPLRFSEPVSPHLAARRERRTISIDDVARFCHEQSAEDNDLLLIEGAGGVMSPVDDAHTNLDLMARLGHPVVLVTGTYLGVLSHTLTSIAVLRARGLVIRGIVVSESEHDVGLADTVEALGQFAGVDIPLYTLARLTGSDEEKWLAAPSLLAICGDQRDRCSHMIIDKQKES
jgi:dethiobiotin synthetase